MPKTVSLDVEFLKKLKAKGWSNQELADRFNVSKSTIKVKLREDRQDPSVLEFSKRVEALLEDVPNDYCRKELNRTILFLRGYQAKSREEKQQEILASLYSGACEIEEIVDDCDFSKTSITDETRELLEDLISEGVVEKRERGGVLNRGAAMKYHYALVKDYAPAPTASALVDECDEPPARQTRGKVSPAKV